MKGRPKIGTYVGTGAAINLVLGFVPDKLEIYNGTDRDDFWVWFPNFAAGTAMAFNTAAAPLAANGVTALNSLTLGAGVTLGTALSEAGKTFNYVAFSDGA